MKKLEVLTAEQMALIEPHRKMWLDKFYQNNGINKELATEQIKWLYRFCGKKEPQVVFMDSPLGVDILLATIENKGQNIGDNIWDNIRGNIRDNIRDNIGDNIWANIRDNIWDNIGANIGDNIWANIRDNIRDNIWANIGDNIWANIGDNIRDNIRDNIGANIWANIGDNIWANISPNIGANRQPRAYYGNCSDYGWMAFYDYFHQLNHFTDYDWNNFNEFKKLLDSGIYELVTLDGLCVACSLPKVIQDAENMLHSTEKAAVIFNDGFSMHFIHGVFITPELFEILKNGTYSFEDWVKEENEEIKSACLSFIEETKGSEALYRFLSAYLKEVDTYTDKKDEKHLNGTTRGMNIGVYTLFKGGYGEVELAFVRCYCPSTDRMFFLSVDPENTNAKDAIASLYRIPRKVANEIKYIQRQGERFSTVLTDKGNEILSAMGKEEISDLVHISGNDYFYKLTYEY
jgi:hypothetical protein